MSYDWNKNRQRKRFKAIWMGPIDEDGFVTKGRLYTITEVMKSGHFCFINDFGKPDMAAAKWFEVIERPKVPRLKLNAN